MASIYKRGRIWWIHYLIGGKSVSRSLRTSNERVALEKKKRLEALEVTGQLPKPSNTPVEDFLQSFCEFLRRTRTRKSVKNDISYLRMFFGPRCPALQPGSTVNHRFQDGRASMSKVTTRAKGMTLKPMGSNALVDKKPATGDALEKKVASNLKKVFG